MNHSLLVLMTLCIASIDTVLGQGCRQCVVDGRRVGGNTVFTRTDGCIEYTWCQCNCDGIWNCPAEYARYCCQQNVSTGCYYCKAKGQLINGGSFFKYQERCSEYNCFCKCDGEWNCPSDQTVDICNTDTKKECRTCDVDGEQKQANSRFDLTDGCYTYFGCICNCSGSWSCAHVTGTYTCRTQRRKTRYLYTDLSSVQTKASSHESYQKSSEE